MTALTTGGQHSVLPAVKDLLPELRTQAADTEAQRGVPAAVIEQISATGLFRLTQPRAYGGFAEDPTVFFRCLRELGHGCGATSWVAGVLGVNSWLLAQYDPRAQDEVWAADPGTLIASSQAPRGRATPVAGGFHLSGRWGFASGCWHAGWALLGGFVVEDGHAPRMQLFLVPGTEYRIDPVWNSVGLSGTGSHDIVVEDVFVPAHRTLTGQQLATEQRPGHARNPEPLYRLPMGSVLPSSISATVVGIASRGYDCFVTAAKERQRANGVKVVDDPFTQVRIARAASEIDAAWLQLERNSQDAYAYAEQGAFPPPELRARVRRDQVRATERAVQAVDLLMDAAGADALRVGDNALQRAWRDVHNARGHVANDPEKALVLYGRDALGLAISDPML